MRWDIDWRFTVSAGGESYDIPGGVSANLSYGGCGLVPEMGF